MLHILLLFHVMDCAQLKTGSELFSCICAMYLHVYAFLVSVYFCLYKLQIYVCTYVHAYIH